MVTSHNITYQSSSDYHNNGSSSSVDVYYILMCIIISVGLPFTLMAICMLYSMVQKGHAAPVYVINLLISDLIQFCCMIVELINPQMFHKIFYCIYSFGLAVSVGLMVCIAMERYLVVAWPLWYCLRRTVKFSLLVCAVVWTASLVFFLLLFFIHYLWSSTFTIFGVCLLLPLPLLIFFLAGTIKALSAANSVPPDEKRRIVGLLVLVLLIYTLLFLPNCILFLVGHSIDPNFHSVSVILARISPLADLCMYVFLRKGAVNKLLASVSCCRMNSDDTSRSRVDDDNIHTVISV